METAISLCAISIKALAMLVEPRSEKKIESGLGFPLAALAAAGRAAAAAAAGAAAAGRADAAAAAAADRAAAAGAAAAGRAAGGIEGAGAGTSRSPR